MPACFFWFDRFLSASQSKRMMLYITYNTRLDARAGGKLRSVAQRRPMCRHRASHGALGNWLDSGVTGTKSLSRRCRRRRVALTPSSSGANWKRFADAGREGAGLQAIALPVGAEKAYGAQAKAPAPPVSAPPEVLLC